MNKQTQESYQHALNYWWRKAQALNEQSVLKRERDLAMEDVEAMEETMSDYARVDYKERDMPKPYGTLKGKRCPKCGDGYFQLNIYVEGKNTLTYNCTVCHYYAGMEFPADTTDEEYEAEGWFKVERATGEGYAKNGEATLA